MASQPSQLPSWGHRHRWQDGLGSPPDWPSDSQVRGPRKGQAAGFWGCGSWSCPRPSLCRSPHTSQRGWKRQKGGHIIPCLWPWWLPRASEISPKPLLAGPSHPSPLVRSCRPLTLLLHPPPTLPFRDSSCSGSSHLAPSLSTGPSP